jgi:hypothetical protein
MQVPVEQNRLLTIPPVKHTKCMLFLCLRKHNKSSQGAGGLFLLIFLLLTSVYAETNYTNDQIANAIYLTEGGTKTNYPYGILVYYKHTTPRQACINTIEHARRDWNGKGDFIEFLGGRYCPIGANNDPRRLNKNWIKNIKYFLLK